MQIAGAYRLGPESGRLLVHTTRTGLGAKAGHDLTIEVTRWHGRATVDPANPADALVAIEVEVESLEVREGTGGVKPLNDADRAEIHKTLKAILRTGQHPTITFRSRQVDGSAASFTCDGELTIMGVTQPVMVQGRVADGRVVGGASVVQSRWGIRPYSAFFGGRRPAGRSSPPDGAGHPGATARSSDLNAQNSYNLSENTGHLESDAPGLGYSSCVGLLLMRPADQLRLALGRLYELVHTECSIK